MKIYKAVPFKLTKEADYVRYEISNPCDRCAFNSSNMCKARCILLEKKFKLDKLLVIFIEK